MKYYECDICGALHPWKWDGDCRDDNARFNHDDIKSTDQVMSHHDRVAADHHDEFMHQDLQ